MTMLSTKVMLYAQANGVDSIDFLDDVLLICEAGVESIKEWNLDIAEPTDAQLAQYEDAAGAKEALVTVQNQRASAYPSIADQLDQIYHEGIDAWKTTIAAVKAEYPKAEGN